MEWFDGLDDLIFPVASDLDRHLFRIIPFDSLLQMFTDKHNILVKTSKWEDSYENFLLKETIIHNGEPVNLKIYQDRLFGQCWTTKQSSDALWRIYSPDKKSVRIKTTIGMLWDSVKGASEGRSAIGRVQYVPQKKLTEDLLKVSPFSVERLSRLIVSSFFIKRISFSHESEYRLIYMCKESSQDISKDIKCFDIKPLDFILNVYFDPRADSAYVDRCTKVLVNAYGYPKDRIHKSTLYDFNPITIEVN